MFSLKKEHLVALFFVLENAYDTTAWHHGRSSCDRPSWPPAYIINYFLAFRHYHVCVRTIYSNLHSQELGVPQGSILAVTLFSDKVNSIAAAVKRGVSCSLFVDDFILFYSSANINVIERQHYNLA